MYTVYIYIYINMGVKYKGRPIFFYRVLGKTAQTRAGHKIGAKPVDIIELMLCLPLYTGGVTGRAGPGRAGQESQLIPLTLTS